jgi:serine phosphatase RsbU (regulator of sigma subunit)
MAEVYDFNQGFERFIRIAGDYLSKMNEFATAVFLDIDEENGKLYLTDMGHSYIYRYSGFLEPVRPAKNPPLGINTLSTPLKTDTLDKPKLLAFMTDGIVEQTDSEGREYPLSRFEVYLGNHLNESIVDISSYFLSDIRDYRGKEPQKDDITFILMRF